MTNSAWPIVAGDRAEVVIDWTITEASMTPDPIHGEKLTLTGYVRRVSVAGPGGGSYRMVMTPTGPHYRVTLTPAEEPEALDTEKPPDPQ